MKIIIKANLLAFLICCLGAGILQAQSKWDARLQLTALDCLSGEARYQLELRSGSEYNWHLGDQNYRLFFDADMLEVKAVHTLLSSDHYSTASIDQNLTIRGEGQEDYSPLDHIDDHLGFLDFSIVLIDKGDINESVMVTTEGFTKVAELVMSLKQIRLNGGTPKDALNIYFSREATAGKITRQFNIVTEHDADFHTQLTEAHSFYDLTAEQGWDANPYIVCEQLLQLPRYQNSVLNRDDIEHLMHGQLSIYPNPASNHINYQLFGFENELGTHELLIHDQYNRLIRQLTILDSAEKVYQYALDGIAPGAYVLQIIKDGKSFQEPLIIIQD